MGVALTLTSPNQKNSKKGENASVWAWGILCKWGGNAGMIAGPHRAVNARTQKGTDGEGRGGEGGGDHQNE